MYNEQIQIGSVLGNSAANTIIFESEGGDSSQVTLNYQLANTLSDYSLSLNGVDYLTIRKMGVLRTNGTNSVIISGGSHYITLQNSRIGDVYSPNTSCDSAIVITNNIIGKID
ncbi:MAG: hypothetical protein ACK53L_13920, partial [Pirellulaceae bacterium]